MIGVGIVTYNREENFYKILESIKGVDHLISIKDGGLPAYAKIPTYDFIQLPHNMGVGFCKNRLIDELLKRGCDDIFIIEDDCLIKDNDVWNYCLSFSKESGLLHFNWNDYRYPRASIATFKNHKAALCHNTEANFSYFHKEFLKNIRFDERFINAWEHVDLEMQGEAQGFLPPFRMFLSPIDLNKYLELSDNGESTISGKPLYNERVTTGHKLFFEKWGKNVSDIELPDLNVFRAKMKTITQKYADRDYN